MTPLPPFIVGALVGVGFLLGMIAGIALDEHARNERTRIYRPIRDMAWTLGAVVVALLVVLCCAGCATVEGWIDEDVIEDVPPDPDDPEPDNPSSDIPDGTIWLHTDVSSWPVMTTLNVTVSGNPNGWITMEYDKAGVWPSVSGLNANPWVFVEIDGQWYAATWEWLRFNQQLKDMRNKSFGGHIKKSPLDTWEPSKDVRIGFMVSGLCRTHTRNVSERSNIVWVKWPLQKWRAVWRGADEGIDPWNIDRMDRIMSRL